ncbi:unnamed protein product, partial [Iphiclides podalirius]
MSVYRFSHSARLALVSVSSIQARKSRTSKSMSRDALHGIRFNPQRIVGFISGGCGGVELRAARADWPRRTCNASTRGAEPSADAPLQEMGFVAIFAERRPLRAVEQRAANKVSFLTPIKL